MAYAYLAAFAGAICYGVGSVLQSASARRVRGADHLNPKGLLDVTTRLPYLAGLGLDLVGWVLVLVALQQLPLFAVQAISASSIGITVLLASVVLKAKPNRPQLASIALMAAGLVALALAAAPDDPEPVDRGFVVAVWIAIGFVAAAGAVAPRLAKGDKGASVLGIVSGLGYGGTAVCARALEADGGIGDVLRDPLTWAIIPYGILGIAFYAAALERGSVAVATASQYASETVVPSIIGLAFLGDHAREGLGWLAASGFVITVAAAVALTFVSPPEQAGG
jgi:drug/metabolite transporter (DMT)-like permease